MDENAIIASVGEAETTDASGNFDQLLQEVYIAPIRSVLVVDDEFPSLDGLLEDPGRVASAQSANAIDLLKGILNHCRTRPEPWLVDVHDARRIDWKAEEAIATHLHHSDLMILDYHLQGETGGGDAAIGVLRRLANNSHFNMVVVYTKGYQEDIRGVFYELVSAFATKNFAPISGAAAAAASALADEFLERSGIKVEELDELITQEIYLALRYARPGSDLRDSPIAELEQRVKNNAQRGIIVKGLTVSLLFDWLMMRAHKRFAGALSGQSDRRMSFHFDAGQDVNWIKMDSLFVTVVNKQYDPSQIESSLLSALRNSDPAPHQLLMAKMRAHMDERGVVAESDILNDLHMQAGWLMELLGSPESERLVMVRSSVDKHWEALGDKLRAGVDTFAHGLLAHLGGDPKDVLKQYFGRYANHSETILARLNAYNNAKPIQASHLMTGHILRLKETEGESYWVCLSPACDLVPGQKESGWRARLGSFMPFAAVKLDADVKMSAALKRASDNVNIFLILEGEVRAFSFCPGGNQSASPVWEQMFAAAGGRFDAQKSTLQITRLRVPAANEAAEGNDAVFEVRTEVSEATVVGQLRYEYALNLLQRLGTSLSRIGLDYQHG
jgi:CheY-like chemotaxis protein